MCVTHPKGSLSSSRANTAVTGGPIKLIVTASPNGSRNKAT